MAKFLLIKTGNLNFFLTLIASFFLFTTGWGQTVWTDKLDYAPGEIAIISGTGWQGDDQIDIYIDEDPALHVDYQHDFYDIDVDDNGNWSVNFQIEEYHLGVTFYVTVTGQQTRRTAEWVFTDAQPTYTHLTSNKNPSAEGENVIFTAKVTRSNINGNNNVSGILQFYIDGAAVGGTQTISNSNNSVTYSINTLETGSHTVIATFVGTENDKSNGFENSSGEIIQVVNGPACTLPVLNLLSPISSNSTAGSCGAVVNYNVTTSAGTTPITYSFSTTGATEISSTSGTGSGTSFNVGVTNVTVTATNSCGSDTESFTVTVEDKVAPTVVTQDLTIQLDANGSATITAAQINNGSSDNCAIATYELDVTSFDCDNIGANTVTLTVTDVNGNSSSETATVTVEDKVAPTVVTQDITVQLDANGSATITAADVNNGSSDACGIASLAVSQTEFTCSNVGPNTVTLTVTDNNGNVSTATATVTVEDNVAPVATAQDITVQLDVNGSATITAADVNNGSSDACGIASLAVSQTEFTCSNVGANTVTLTVTDNNGNVSTATATVTVQDNVAPVATAQDITVQLDANGSATITAADVNNGSSDACGIASLAVSQSEFTCSNVGANTVTLTVTDNNGNVSTATATVTVEDNVAPEISCVSDQTKANDIGTCAYTVIENEFDPIFNDNCSGAMITNNYTGTSTLAGAVFAEGETVVEWTVTDASGNKASCSFTITVTNDEPVITNISGPVGPQQKGTAVNLTAEYVDNNLASAKWEVYSNGVIVSSQSGTINSIDGTVKGTFNLDPNVYVVKLTVTDYCGKTDYEYYEYIVVFDPNGGFVTGGGWIESPATAMTSGVVGRANFGFNAKYKTGRNNTTEVDGNTNFQFKAGDLHFSSSVHHAMSLVISGAKATYTGEGTINGTGSYEFRLIAVDGDLIGSTTKDKFRIKIWTKGSPSDVVYDNERIASESADATTDIAGGSIVIHKPKSTNKSAEVVEKTVAVEEGVELTNVEILSSLAVAPNPVRTDAVVRFSLVEDASVNISVFDFSGREVGRLFSGSVKANQVQDVDFNRRNLPSGVYIVKLTTDRGNSYDRQIILE